MKFISQEQNLQGQVILLRSDINSDVVKGKVSMNDRIKEAAKTIKFLLNKKASVIVIAHQGQKGKEDFISLKQHAKLLNKLVKIKFVEDTIGQKAVDEINKLKDGQAILLENLRFLEDETGYDPKKQNKIVKTLFPLFDYYVNDAFSVCHRPHASIVGFTDKPSFGGLLLEKEVSALKSINVANAVYVLGGAKAKDYLKIIGKNKILACGLFAQSILVSKGKDLGAQNKYLEKEADLNRELIEKLKNTKGEILLPVDFAVKVKGKRKEIDIDEFPSEYEIYDIGGKTIKMYVDEIKKAPAIYMKGPAGDFSSKGFEKGTFSILKTISQNKGFSLLGGGHLTEAMAKSKIPKSRFSHISLSGGALLSYIAGEKLPGLEALENEVNSN